MGMQSRPTHATVGARRALICTVDNNVCIYCTWVARRSRFSMPAHTRYLHFKWLFAQSVVRTSTIVKPLLIKGTSMSTSKRATPAKTKAATKTARRRPARPTSVTQAKAKPAAKKVAKPQDAIAILRADHTLVSGLFSEYEKTRSVPKKKALVAKICTELSVHAQVEEEIFYPAVKAALRDKELVPEATVEHATLKFLISQVEGKEPDGEMFDAKIAVLSEYVKHHVKEEQNEMFPKAKNTKLDMGDLGARILARKEELKPKMAAKAERPGILASIKDAMGMAA